MRPKANESRFGPVIRRYAFENFPLKAAAIPARARGQSDRVGVLASVRDRKVFVLRPFAS